MIITFLRDKILRRQWQEPCRMDAFLSILQSDAHLGGKKKNSSMAS